MAYIFDPIQGTFIDDKDKTLGNKLMIADLVDDLEPGPLKDEMQEDFDPSQEKYEEYLQRKRLGDRPFLMADGGVARQNFAAAGLALPALSYPVSYGLATVLGISTAGGAKVLGERVTNHLKNNPQILEDPRFKAAALAFGITPSGLVFGPDADEMEKTRKEIQESLKPGETKPIDQGPIKTGETTPPKIETTESFPAELEKLPFKEEFPMETQQLPIIFEQRNLKADVKNRRYDKEGFFENIEKYSKEKHGGNLRRAIADLTDTTDKKQLNNVYQQITQAGERKGFTFDRTGKGLQSNIAQSKVPVDLNTLTTALRTNTGILDNRIKELKGLDLNKVYNKKELADIIGLKRAVDTSDRAQVRKDNFLMELLLDQGLKYKDIPGGKVGFTAKETIDALKDYSKNKVLNYESRSYSGNLRKKSTESYKLRSKIEGKDYMNLQQQINKSFTRTLLNDDLYLPNSVAEFGHNPVPVALTEKIKMLNNPKLAKKIFNIQNQTWQGKEINRDTLMRTSGALEETLKGIDKFFNKKITKNNIQELNKLSKELDDYYNSVVEKGGKAVEDLPFHKNVIGKLNLIVPNVGDKLTADNFNVDMSGVDKRFIIGNVDLINPDAVRYADLTKEEKEIFGQNIIDQKIEQLKEFYGPKGANFPQEVIDDFIEKLEFGTAEVMGMAEREFLGKLSKAAGGGVNISPLPRMNFSNGGAAGADESFAKELEYYFLNPDSELPQAQSFKETMNPIEILNDMIDPRNLPYYADVLLRSGVRVGEFAGRILPAAGRLASDLIRRPAFKVTGDGGNYVQDYDEVPETNIKGTGIFTEFLENITPTATEKAIGLESLIQTEEQKLKDRRSTIGPKVFADTFGLGLELTAPIFPGLKLLNAYAAAKKLPKDRVTEELLNKEIDQVLAQKGMTRREFLQMSGAGATVALAKMLGIVDFFPKAGKVSRAASKMAMDTQVTGMPAWFKDAVYAIEKKGVLKSRGDIKGVEPDFFEMTLNTKAGNKKVLMSKNDNTGEITIDWTTNYYDTEIPVTITYKPGESGYQNLLSDPEFPQSVERYNVEVDAPEFEYKTVDVESMGPEDTSFDSAINLDIKEEADAVVEALEELGLTLTKGQKKEAAENFRYYNEVELDEGAGANTQNPLDENDVFTLMDSIKRNQR